MGETMPGLDQITPIVDAVVAHIKEGVILTNEKGDVLYHNQAATRLLGVNEIQSVGQLNAVSNLQLPAAISCAVNESGGALVRKNGEGECVKQFEQRITRNGITRFIEINTTDVQVPGEEGGIRLLVLNDVTEKRRLEAVFHDNLNAGLITQDPRMLEISSLIEDVAPTRAPVLLQGESGTGKTLLARLLHKKSSRADKPLIEVNCAAIPEALLESELFGHVKGAFTGAITNRPGRLQAAHGGTLFLDEISEIPLHLQPKLLKALEEQKFHPVGSDEVVEVDIRIIAASNRNLREMVDKGSFRADLYYRLAVISIDIPPLRERPGDIPLLIRHMCDTLVQRGYPSGLDCEQEAMAMMLDYPWPGNVRELSNAVEHAMILAKDGIVTPICLPREIREYYEKKNRGYAENDLDAQRREITDALKAAGGNRAEAARLLGIDRSTLWRRMHKLGLA
ncbi:MAG: AAA family ATPase [Gammaproteobacteria bacterium]|nr:MAG: AAA family ATPase [Gammaproteobacteria bacterium]